MGPQSWKLMTERSWGHKGAVKEDYIILSLLVMRVGCWWELEFCSPCFLTSFMCLNRLKSIVIENKIALNILFVYFLQYSPCQLVGFIQIFQTD
jgi:hypothetical protein